MLSSTTSVDTHIIPQMQAQGFVVDTGERLELSNNLFPFSAQLKKQ